MKSLVSFLLLATAALQAQLGPFAPGAYTLVQETRIDRTTFEYEYRISATNTGTATAINVSAVATSNHPNITIVSGSNTLNFPNINGGQSALSTNTFRFRFLRTVAFNPSMINWAFNASVAAPTANAGQNQNVNLGQLVTLNASSSTDPNGLPLTRQWSLTLPASCAGINLSSTTDVMPTFPANCVGNFSAQLIVRNSLNVASAPVSVNISTAAVAPTANAGSNQNLNLTQATPTVSLNGSASTSPGNLPLTYTWSFLNRPTNSAATLSNVNAIQPTFTADRIGLYRLQLIVNNGFLNSAPSTVEITTSNLRPTANPGNSQSATINTLVNLNGNQSTDPNSLPLTYTWSLTTRPATSNATLSALNIVNPTFTLDVNGTYIAQLVVCNPFQCSDPATVTISTQLLAPTARPGNPQTVNVGATVNLSGLTSSDPQGLPLTYLWSFNSRPNGSSAAFTSTTSATPSFTPDRFGDYVVQLTVSNGTLSSAPATVTISTNYVAPTANAGTNQNATVNGTVNLSGLASQSFSGYGLTYAWSFNTRPNNSNATLTNPTSAQPTFVPDLPGLYIVQLIVNDTIQNSAPSTVQISASFGNTITVTGPTSILSFDQPNGTVTLSNPAGSGGQTVNLTASGTGTVTIPSSVVVPQNNTAANFPITGGTTSGPVAIQGAFTGFASGSLNTTIANRGMTLTTTQPILAIGQSFGGTLTLNNPAPTGGATINLSSSNPGVSTVSAPTLNIPAGQTTANFTYTAVGIGQANIDVSAPGYIATAALVTVSGSTILLPNNFSLGLTQSTVYPVGLSTAAPTGGTTINFTTQPGVTINPSSVFIAAGQTSPTTSPTITGNALGTATINATAIGFPPAADSATVTIGVSLNPGTVSVNVGQTSNVTVSLSAPAPTGGISLNITGNNAATATIPSPLVISAGQTQGTLVVTGVAQGSTTATVSGTNTNSPTLTINVTTPQPVTISGTTNLGRNAQETLTVNLGQNAPPAGLTATISTTSPNILLSTNPALQGTSSISVTFAGNTQVSPPIYVQNVNASSGSATVRFEAQGYATTDRTFNFFPSAFTLTQTTINTTASAPALSLSINFNRLSGTTLDGQQTMRGGYSESLSLTNSTPAAATVTTPLTFTGNQSSQTFNSALTPTAAGGQTNINITQPAGYTTPSPNPDTVVTVSNLTVSLLAAFSGQNVIGRNQQAAHLVRLNGPVSVLTPITLTAPAGTLLSASATTAGSSSLTVNIAATQTDTPQFFIQNVNQDSGSPSISITSTNPLVASGTGSVLYTRSGFYPWSSSSSNLNMNLNQPAAPIQVWFARLDGANARTADMPMRGGYSETITFTTTPNGVVTLPASVTFNSNTAASQTFDSAITPASVNSTSITINQPTGYFATTTYPPLTVTVSNNQITFTSLPASLGNDQVACGSLNLNPAAPAGGLSLQVSSPGNIAFSTSSTVAGQNPLTLNFNQGGSSTTFCVHNIATSTGSAAINVTVLTAGSNYAASPANVALWPSGFYPWTTAISLNTLNSNGSNLEVWFAMINPTTGAYAGDRPLRPGAGPKTITINNSNPAVVSLPASVVFPDNGTSTQRTYTGIIDNASPPATGNSTITFTQPTGHSANITYTQSVVTVSAPTISISCSPNVGFNLQAACSATLSQSLPSGLTANLSSSNPNLLLSMDRTAVGAATITPNFASGTGSFTFYTQALASSGTATVTIAIPGYSNGSANVTLSNSGFYTYPGATMSVGQTRSVEVYSAVLGAGPGFPRIAEQEVRGGTSVTLNMASTNPGIHSALPTVTFSATPLSSTGTSRSFNVTGVATGTASISVVQPAGNQQTSTYSYILTVN
jgi:hypothetical protein